MGILKNRMNSITNLALALVLGLTGFMSFSQQCYAGPCLICMNETDTKTSFSCSLGHEICRSCMEWQVQQTTADVTQGNYAKIRDTGICCPGRDPQNGQLQCNQAYPLSVVRKLLSSHQSIMDDLETKLRLTGLACTNTNSNSNSEPTTQSALSTLPRSWEEQVRAISAMIEEAFNLCCPNPGCKGVLSPISGCNAATCESCGASFCYLCLEPNSDSNSNHAHVRKVHGSVFDYRDGHTGLPTEDGHFQEEEKYSILEKDPRTGEERQVLRIKAYKYEDRYHWLIARKKLEALLNDDIPADLKTQAIASMEKFFRANKMWPLPIGQKMEHWVNAVIGDSQIDQKNKIALLQNELVYVTQRQKQLAKQTASSSTQNEELAHRGATLKLALEKLNAPILTSLDIHGASVVQNPHVTPLAGDDQDPDIQRWLARVRQMPTQRSDGVQFFDLGGAGGQIYRITDPEQDPTRRVPPFVLSAAAANNINNENAEKYCESIGAALPTKEELEALGRAMGWPGGRVYNARYIDGIENEWVWSASVFGAGNAYLFNGFSGFVFSFRRYSVDGSVRCVVRGAPRG